MSYASVSSITRSAGALSHHGDHLQGRQDNASLSPSRPFWPSQLLWPPRHSPLFGGRLETSISRNLPTVRAQGPEVCRARPPSPSTRGSLTLPRCISVLPPPAPRHAPSRASEGLGFAGHGWQRAARGRGRERHAHLLPLSGALSHVASLLFRLFPEQLPSGRSQDPTLEP